MSNSSQIKNARSVKTVRIFLQRCRLRAAWHGAKSKVRIRPMSAAKQGCFPDENAGFEATRWRLDPGHDGDTLLLFKRA